MKWILQKSRAVKWFFKVQKVRKSYFRVPPIKPRKNVKGKWRRHSPFATLLTLESQMLASAYIHRSSRKRETVLRQLVLRALEWQTFSDLGNDCEMTKQALLFAKMTRILAFMAMFCTQGKNNSKKIHFPHF